MKLSYDWLSDFVDLSSTDVNTVADKLTMGAFEVEDIEKFGDQLEGRVVLGEIREINKHPDADKLNVTKTCIGKTENGEDDIQQIVCGGKNIAVGQKIPVATVGSAVVNRTDGSVLKIKKSKIRGVESFGMLCSADELGFSEDAAEKIKAKVGDGIYVLAGPLLNGTTAEDKTQGFTVGEDIRKVLNLKQDFVLNVGARSNRGDALSVIGQAREIAALLDTEVKPLTVANFAHQLGANINEKTELNDDVLKGSAYQLEASSETNNFSYDENLESVQPVIEDTKDCGVFHTVAIEGLEIKESPDWLKQRLEAMGTRSINNVVDVSNYVLLEMGQPMHFYDRTKLVGDKLYVRRAKAGEKIKTLEEKEYDLSETNLLIADESVPVCLAGAMGGFDSQITDDTTSIIIEAAAFTASSVRRSARAAGVESESKRRFERGVDKSRTILAVLRAVELLAKTVNKPFKVGKIHTAGDPKVEKQKLDFRMSQLKRYLGIDIDKATVISLLKPLEINCVEEKNTDSTLVLSFEIPSFRQADIHREEDLVEEIGRLYGFDKIPAQAPPNSVGGSAVSEKESLNEKIQSVFMAHGFSQAMLSSLVGETLNSIVENDYKSQTKIKMLNPLSREHSMLRQSLIPGLIQAASRNFAYDKSKNIKLFEQGKVYFLNAKDHEVLTVDDTVENPKVAAIMIAKNSDWDAARPNQPEDIFKLKALVEDLYPRATFTPLAELEAKEQQAKHTEFFKLADNKFCHPGIAAIIYSDRREVGYIAKLHPSISEEWDLPKDHTYIVELNEPQINQPKFKSIPNTPIIERDMTADISDSVKSQDIMDLIKKNSSKDLVDIKLVSLYKPDKKSAQQSLSYRLKWQSPSETLTGEFIDGEINKLKGLLEEKLGVKFRA